MGYKVGDAVDFKLDIEGKGTIVEIRRNNWDTDFIIAVTKPGSSNAEMVHPAADFNCQHKCMTVICSDYNLMANEDK